MKRLLGILLAVGVLAVALPAGPAGAAPAKALCPVCQAMHGESREETVRAVRVHEGTEYGFCSEECAGEFDADPVAFVPRPLPRAAPRFSLADLAGQAISNRSLEGRVVLLDFWATWCGPCRKSMPELQALHERYADQGFDVVGISIDEGRSAHARVKKFIAAKKIRYPIAVDSEADPAWAAFHVKAIPSAFLLDRDGRIVAQWTGIPARGGEIEAQLTELLAAD
jgi:peroxiredoxin/YHS domain-containing protein